MKQQALCVFQGPCRCRGLSLEPRLATSSRLRFGRCYFHKQMNVQSQKRKVCRNIPRRGHRGRRYVATIVNLPCWQMKKHDEGLPGPLGGAGLTLVTISASLLFQVTSRWIRACYPPEKYVHGKRLGSIAHTSTHALFRIVPSLHPMHDNETPLADPP